MPKNKIRKIRNKWYAQNPYCPNCGVLMVLPDDVPGFPKMRNIPDNMCTYDHKYPRTTELRHVEAHRNSLLCNKCNNEKARLDDLKYLGLDGIRARCGRFPQDLKKTE
jgi:hypothetical protein